MSAAPKASLAAVALGLLLVGSTDAQSQPLSTPLPSVQEWLSARPIRWPEASESGRQGESNREGQEIETDRDSFTPATTTAGRSRLIFESAYSVQDNRGVKETHSFPEALFRYGLTDRLELRFGFNYEVGGAANDASSSGAAADEEGASTKLERQTRVLYGAKLLVNEQAGWVPGSALILQGFTPTSGLATDTQFVGTYVFGWEFFQGWKLDSAIRYGTESENQDRFATWAPSVVLKVPVGERVSVHGEYFGLFSSGKEREFSRQFFSPGVHFLVTDDLEVGVRVGWGLNDQSARFFANAGVGLRF